MKSNQNFEADFHKILDKYKEKAFVETNKVLESAANNVRQTMQGATQNVNTGRFKAGWKVKKYPNEKYVYNGPLTNIIEFSKRGPRPFIRETWNRIQGNVQREILNGLRQKLK
jgi:hypothetical protein